jgi:reverse gyrase
MVSKTEKRLITEAQLIAEMLAQAYYISSSKSKGIIEQKTISEVSARFEDNLKKLTEQKTDLLEPTIFKGKLDINEVNKGWL